VEAAADKLGLTQEQRDKIKEIRASHAEQHKALRAERRALMQEEMKALGTALTPKQQEEVKELAEDRVETAKERPHKGLPMFSRDGDTLAERTDAAADKIGLSEDQRRQMMKTLASYANKHDALREK